MCNTMVIQFKKMSARYSLSVTWLQKEARSSIAKALSTYNFGHSERIVRINSYSSGFALDDLQTILTGPAPPDAIVLPKPQNAEQVDWVCDFIMGTALKLANKLCGNHLNINFTKMKWNIADVCLYGWRWIFRCCRCWVVPSHWFVWLKRHWLCWTYETSVRLAWQEVANWLVLYLELMILQHR